MIKQLRCKFILVNMAIVTAMLLVIFGMVLRSTSADLEKESIRTMRGLTQEGKFPANRPGDKTEQVHLPFFCVTLDQNKMVISKKGGYFDLSDTESLKEIITAAQNSPEDIGILRNYNLRFMKKGTPFGETLVFVDISGEQAIMSSLLKSCILIGVVSFSVFLGLSFLLARWAIRPVEKAWNQQRQFVADASHELKTPLTVIMTTAEIMSQNGCSQEQFPQMIGSVLTMAQQMRGLVESLLELARVDNGEAKMDSTHLCFSELVSDALLPFEPIYFEQGLELEGQVEEGIYVKGSPAHLKQVVEIFLDNALKYSAPGGTVSLHLKRQGNTCVFAVSSPGEAISKEDLERIFHRFVRLDKARAMDHSYGLGLSIAQTIVGQHKGKIWAESESGRNTFFVQLTTAQGEV